MGGTLVGIVIFEVCLIQRTILSARSWLKTTITPKHEVLLSSSSYITIFLTEAWNIFFDVFVFIVVARSQVGFIIFQDI